MRTTISGLASAGITCILVGFMVCTGASAQQTSDEEACALPFAFPTAAIEARILMVSEVHGTHETFRLVGELACNFARSGDPVTVAIEMSRDEQSALDAYLASDGGEAARSALISRPRWETSTLANVALLAMIERLRDLSRSGAVSLMAIDASPADLASPPTLTPEQEEGLRAYVRRGLGDGAAAEAQLPGFRNMIALTTVRDRIMAELVGDAVRRDPSRRFVVLLGGAHISKLSGVPFPGVDSMASLLVSEGLSLTSLTAIFVEGAFWGCLVDGGGNCGPHEFPTGGFDAQIAGRSPGIYLSDEMPGYDGVIVFERVTAAEPANPRAATQASTPQR